MNDSDFYDLQQKIREHITPKGDGNNWFSAINIFKILLENI